jgi:hypothetical protein
MYSWLLGAWYSGGEIVCQKFCGDVFLGLEESSGTGTGRVGAPEFLRRGFRDGVMAWWVG